MVISSFISSVLVLVLGIWAFMRLESSMNIFAEKQLLIEPSKFSYKMWKDMPVTMYQSFTFFNLTNWAQVKAVGQKPHFVEVGPYVYKTLWSKAEINFLDEERLVNYAEKKQWHFQAHLSRGYEEDLIWTINTPLMTALALMQNAPVITRNIVSVILDGLGEGAFIKRPIKSLLFEGYSDLIVSVGPLFDRRFANFNGKFAYLYNKNDTVDGLWTVSTGTDDVATLNKITRFQNNIVNMTSFASGQPPQGLNEVKAECAPAWSLDQSTNGQLFAPFNKEIEGKKLEQQLQKIRARSLADQQQVRTSANLATVSTNRPTESIVQAPKRFFSRQAPASVQSDNDNTHHHHHHNHHNNPRNQHYQQNNNQQQQQSVQEKLYHLRDLSKFIFYPDLCRPLHLLQSKQDITSDHGIDASRYSIDPRVFMNSSQVPTNKCYEMNPRPALTNGLVNMPSLVGSGSSPFAIFIPPASNHHQNHHHHEGLAGGLFERANHPSSFLNNALHTLSATANQSNGARSSAPVSRLGRVRQLFSNIVSQRMSAAAPLLPGPASLMMATQQPPPVPSIPTPTYTQPVQPVGGSDRWVTQFRFKWPRGVFSIGQCQLGAPIYVSLPHFLDADEYYLEQVDGLKPNRSLHEFYIDVESTLHSIPVSARARLQLNVATPELRFRNIPNAMIPVLWQEVTFKIDKPVASLLYWSFTMSGRIYKGVALLIMCSGFALLVLSLVSAFERHKQHTGATREHTKFPKETNTRGRLMLWNRKGS